LSDQQEQFVAMVREAASDRRPLRIRGSGSKDFYGLPVTELPVLDTRGHSGIVEWFRLWMTPRQSPALRS